MDIVITYVNGLDPVWQKEYEKHTNTPIVEKRFRDWGTLKYLFRGIEKNMPFIRKVHLVVSGESQVPEWINRNEVNVVLHSDIIPAEHLPTFNSNTIEMHLHRIKDLDEEYLYFNDDIFPVAPCKPEDFFRNGKVVIKFSRHFLSMDMFKKICRNSDRLAHKLAGMKPPCSFLRPQHICTPMLKSICQHIYRNAHEDIISSLTRTRTDRNYTQYLFLDYMYITGMAIDEKINKKHFSTAITTATKISSFIQNPTRKLVCINDVHLSDKRYGQLHSAIHQAFEQLLPHKSKYEI